MSVQQPLTDKMREMLEVQGRGGNWDFDPYMHGMYNGMEYMLSMVEGREPNFREAPIKWICDIDATKEKPLTSTRCATSDHIENALGVVEGSSSAQRQPLTDEQLKLILIGIDPETKRLPPGFRQFARAIEAAHGIGGKAK